MDQVPRERARVTGHQLQGMRDGLGTERVLKGVCMVQRDEVSRKHTEILGILPKRSST